MKILLILAIFSGSNFFSQNFVWNASAADNDFFTETNWEDVSAGLAPDSDSFKWNIPINLNLSIQNVTTTISTNRIINLGTGCLTIYNATINGNALSNGAVTLTDLAYIDLSNAIPFQNNVTMNLNSGIAW
jgi:hypothetical protein